MIRYARKEVQYEKTGLQHPVFPADSYGLTYDKEMIKTDEGYTARWRRWETVLQEAVDETGYKDVETVSIPLGD